MHANGWALLYVALVLVAALAYILVLKLLKFRPLKLDLSRKVDEPDKVLDVNVAVLASAFVLVVTVVLVIAQLAGGMGVVRAVRPPKTLPLYEFAGFAVAISVTLLGRWVVPGVCKYRLTHISSWLTLASILVLVPYFYHQRQHISTREVIADALSRSMRGATLRDPALMDVLLSAAKRGDYLLFRDGVDTLSGRAIRDSACRRYLEQLRQRLEEDGDFHAREIVTSALGEFPMRTEKQLLPLSVPARGGRRD
jgi:hypothetical protein